MTVGLKIFAVLLLVAAGVLLTYVAFTDDWEE